MNEKLTLPTLIQLVALQSGESKKLTEEFVKEFFNAVTAALAAGEQVKIKSLGVFKTVEVGARKSVNVSTGEEHEIPAHRKVVFVPSKEVAALVNEPFEMFETVEVEEDFSEEPTETTETPEIAETTELTEKTELTETAELTETPVSSDQSDLSDRSDMSDLSDQSDRSDQSDLSDMSDLSDQSDRSDQSDLSESSEIPEQFAPEKPAKKRFGVGFLVGFLSAVIVCGLVFIGLYYFDWQTYSFTFKSGNTTAGIQPVVKTLEGEIQQGESPEALADTSAIEVPTEPSDEVEYDVITKTRYLTTMAKDHYGNFNLWPYIYMENQDFLGHPDRIKPGTQVAVPSLSKYGVDPKNPEDIAKAKKLGIEIYSRYK